MLAPMLIGNSVIMVFHRPHMDKHMDKHMWMLNDNFLNVSCHVVIIPQKTAGGSLRLRELREMTIPHFVFYTPPCAITNAISTTFRTILRTPFPHIILDEAHSAHYSTSLRLTGSVLTCSKPWKPCYGYQKRRKVVRLGAASLDIPNRGCVPESVGLHKKRPLQKCHGLRTTVCSESKKSNRKSRYFFMRGPFLCPLL